MSEKEYAEHLIRVATELAATPKSLYSVGIEGVRPLMDDAKRIVDTALRMAAERAAKS
jgi:hypothetical protein